MSDHIDRVQKGVLRLYGSSRRWIWIWRVTLTVLDEDATQILDLFFAHRGNIRIGIPPGRTFGNEGQPLRYTL